MTSVPATKPTVYVIFDIEKGGGSYAHALIDVGACVADFTRGVILKHHWACKDEPGNNAIERRCIRECLGKQPKMLERADAEGWPLDKQMNSLVKFLYDDIDAKYPNDRFRVVLLSDNAAFDIAHLDHHMRSVLPNEHHLRHSRGGVYREVEDPSERLSALGLYKVAMEFIAKNLASHDHLPENDAEHIFWQHAVACAATNLLTKADYKLSDVEFALISISKHAKKAEKAEALLALARGDLSHAPDRVGSQ